MGNLISVFKDTRGVSGMLCGIILLLLAGCSDPLLSSGNGTKGQEFVPPGNNTENNTPGGEEEITPELPQKGRAVINLVPAETGGILLPRNPDFVCYSAAFTHESGESVPPMNLDGTVQEFTVELEGGLWTVNVLGFTANGTEGEPIPAVRGGTEVAITPEEDSEAAITLEWIGPEAGNAGTLSFTVEFPKDRVKVALLAFSLAGDENQTGYTETVDLTKIAGADISEGVLELPSGIWTMKLILSGLYPPLVINEDLYIYPDKETSTPVYHFDSGDFSEPVKLSGIAELRAYLDSLPENTVADPYLINLGGIDLSSADSTGDTLRTLYDSLTRFAALDLSSCGGSSLPGITVTAAPNKKNLIALSLPETVTALSRNCFAGCTNLTVAELPGVIFAGRGAFADCTVLEQVYLPRLETLEGGISSSQGIFYRCTALSLVWLPEARDIGAYAFYGCTTLKDISLPAAETLGAYSLKNCTALVSVNIPKVHTLDSQVFHGCDSLVSLSLPRVHTIGKQGFYSCNSLISVSLPSALSIGSQTFYGCPALVGITLGENPPVLEGRAVFSGDKPSEAIYVPGHALQAYKASELEGWTELLREKLRPLTL
jgi:hypothetical protein